VLIAVYESAGAMQGISWSRTVVFFSYLANSSTLTLEARCSSEASVATTGVTPQKTVLFIVTDLRMLHPNAHT
jgi:hypothetical protein